MVPENNNVNNDYKAGSNKLDSDKETFLNQKINGELEMTTKIALKPKVLQFMESLHFSYDEDANKFNKQAKQGRPSVKI